MDNSFRRSWIRFRRRRYFFPQNYMRSLRQWRLYTANQIFFSFLQKYKVYFTIGSLRSKIYQRDKTRAREMYTLRFPVFHSRRTLLRCKFIQFQSHEYLHLSLTTLGIHFAGKIGKINNNDDAWCGALLNSFRKRRLPGWSWTSFSVAGGIVRNFYTHRATLASETQISGEKMWGREKKNIRVSAYGRRKGLSVAVIIWWLSDFSAREKPGMARSPFLLLAATNRV